MGNLNRNHIFIFVGICGQIFGYIAKAEEIRHVIPEGNIAVWTSSKIVAVYPDLTVFVYAVKTEKIFFAFRVRGKGEMFAVPGGATDHIARSA